MASIDKRPNGKYRARWRPVPGGPQKTRLFDRKIDAQRFLAEVEHRRHSGTYIDPADGRQTFTDYAEDWAAAQDWKHGTRSKSWPYTLKRLKPHLGELRLCDIDKLTLERTRAKLAALYARATVEGTMHRAMAVMRHAYANGKIGRDPTVGVDAAPKRRADDTSGRVTPDDVPSRAEALAILAGAPADYRAAVALGLAGLRVGEVLGLTAGKVDLAARRVTIDQQTDGYMVTTPKAEKVRTITVPGLVANELRRHLRDRPSGWLFPGGGKDGQLHRERFYVLAWYPALAAAGLGPVNEDGQPTDGAGRFKFHALRHFAASTLLAEGAPLTAVAAHLGDTVETVSRVYVHWLRDEADVPAGVLDRVLAPAEDPLRTTGTGQ